MKRADAAALLPTLGDEAQCRYLSRQPFATEAELWGWLADPDWQGLTWIAQDRASARVAGRFVAVPGEGPSDMGRETSVFEIGYITCADRQGEGVARECTDAVIAHLSRQGAHRFTAEVDARNAASIRLLQSLGFNEDVHLRAQETTHIGVCDLHFYTLVIE